MAEKARPEEHYGIRILKDGGWLYNGTPITRHNLVKLFASVLSRDAAGDYWLTTPAERGRIEVEDVPFIIVEMMAEAPGPGQILRFRTNVDDWVALDRDHPLYVRPYDGEPVPYLVVRHGLEARLSRPVYYQLAEMAVAGPQGTLGIFSSGDFYPLGQASS
jgi:hypothetical protein